MIRRLALSVLALHLSLGATALAAEPAAVPKAKKLKVAVLDVKSQGLLDPKTFDGVGPLLSSELSNQRADLTVVSAGDIKAMIGFEREKQLLGCSEGSCLAEIGGALGVDYILSTSGSKLGGTWLVSMSLIDVVKQRTLKQLTKRTERENKLVDLCIEAIQEMAKAIPAPAPPAAATTTEATTVEKPAVATDTPRADPTGEVKQPARRSKALTGVLIGVGAGAVVVGGALYGLGWAQHSKYESAELTRAQAQSAATWAPSGLVLGVVGIGVLTWGIVRAVLPEDAPQVSLAPTRNGAYASVTLPLP